MKRILTIQDISCVGKCSLTVALPIISACGVETAVLPTAVLSNHTAFKGFTFRDLTEDLLGIADKWQDEKITFDGIYTGYLGSKQQIEIVSEFFKRFKTDKSIFIVDPAMADNGKLYKGFDTDFAGKMATLCSQADVIVPNLTEVAFMLNIPYVEKGYTEDYVKNLLVRLTDLGTTTAIITGISFENDKLGAYGYNSKTKEFFSYYREYLPVSFHGTGDVFASALCGAVSNGKSIKESTEIAVDYTVECMKETIKNTDHNWYGVDFESALYYLIKRVK